MHSSRMRGGNDKKKYRPNNKAVMILPKVYNYGGKLCII